MPALPEVRSTANRTSNGETTTADKQILLLLIECLALVRNISFSGVYEGQDLDCSMIERAVNSPPSHPNLSA
jgi:hypothetical protein